MNDLGQDIQAAELLLAQSRLETRFQQNMELLHAVMPEAFARFQTYRPRQMRLLLEESGEPLLVNGHVGNTPVYQGMPRDYCAAQVAQFRRDPKYFRTHPRPSTIMDEANNAHVSNANRLIALLLEHPGEDPQGLPETVDFMLMLGVGLGYQVDELLAEHDIRNLCVVEPEPDIFYASLHTLDWGPVLEHFAQPGRSLELIVGEAPEACERQLEAYLWWIGGYHVFRPYIFEHLMSEKLATSFRGFFDRLMPKMTGQLGYFDDERVGLAHTVANQVAGVPFLHDHAALNGEILDKPAFVVANGPSLDHALDYLRSHRDQAVLFSCGSALGSLRKAGIKPDFHVEMERSYPVVEWLGASTDEAYRDGITLLALNTVHPQVFGLFPQGGMAMKPNDLGVDFLSDYIEPDGRVAHLDWCNPNAGNAGVSFASALGFRDVTLFGLDLGFPAGEQHHSRLSAHYDVREDQRHTLGLQRPDDANNFIESGNFGGEVVSTHGYRISRIAVEQIIACTPGMRCANTSRGVRISGATPLSVDGFPEKGSHKGGPTGPAFDTRAYAQGVFRRYFGTRGIAPLTASEAHAVVDGTAPVLAALRGMLDAPVESRVQGMALLAELNGVLQDLNESGGRHVATLLRGSVTMFCLLLAQALHRFGDEKASVALFHEARTHVQAFLDHAGRIASGDVLALDRRSRNLKEKWSQAG